MNGANAMNGRGGPEWLKLVPTREWHPSLEWLEWLFAERSEASFAAIAVGVGPLAVSVRQWRLSLD
jgi:hypothetical protein